MIVCMCVCVLVCVCLRFYVCVFVFVCVTVRSLLKKCKIRLSPLAFSSCTSAENGDFKLVRDFSGRISYAGMC